MTTPPFNAKVSFWLSAIVGSAGLLFGIWYFATADGEQDRVVSGVFWTLFGLIFILIGIVLRRHDRRSR